MSESLYCGLLTDSDEFSEYLEKHFAWHKTAEKDHWHVRDSLSGAWNAALDAQQGLKLTNEERSERARRIDKPYIDEYHKKLEDNNGQDDS